MATLILLGPPIERLGRQGQAGTSPFNDLHHLKVQMLSNFQVLGILSCIDIGKDIEVQRIVADLRESYTR